MKLIYYPDFLESIAEQAGYLAQEADVQLADRFIEAVKDTTEQIQMMPFLGFNREFNNNKLKNVRVGGWRALKNILFFMCHKKKLSNLYIWFIRQEIIQNFLMKNNSPYAVFKRDLFFLVCFADVLSVATSVNSSDIEWYKEVCEAHDITRSQLNYVVGDADSTRFSNCRRVGTRRYEYHVCKTD